MSLISTPGANNANSYVSLAESNAYFASSFGKSSWSAVIDATKEIVLIEATRLLDQFFDWNGEIDSSSTQSLRWPRIKAYDADGRVIDETIVPVLVKNATCELAYYINTTGGFDLSENALDKVKVGPITIDFSQSVRPTSFPKIVIDMLASMGGYTVTSANGIKMVNLVRT